MLTSELQRKSLPQPPTLPFLKNLLGHIHCIDTHQPVHSMMKLAKQFGEIFALQMPGQRLVIVSSKQISEEVCNSKLFDKHIHNLLRQMRAFAGDGIFTAHTSEPNWEIAHRALMPIFGPSALRSQFDSMVEIAEQCLSNWERRGPDAELDVVDQMARLTLDTIGLCSFGYRFKSFQSEELHPFTKAMGRSLREASRRARRPGWFNALPRASSRKFAADNVLLRKIAAEMMAEHRANPAEKERPANLLTAMINARDPETGEALSEEHLLYQIVTFAIAGHETTAALLAFALRALLKNPESLKKCRNEVDRVLGFEPPSFEHLRQLTYIDQVLKETLRLWPTAPTFALKSKGHDFTLSNGHVIRRNDVVLVLLPAVHRDVAIWGDDAEQFVPERMAPEKFKKIPPGAWKPFGTGPRACMGRGFALQEATLALAMILQRFDLHLSSANKNLEQIVETPGLKPANFYVTAKRRASRK